MKLEDAIIYVDAIIEEAKDDDSNLSILLDDIDIEALEMVLSVARSEYMEEQAGADQKAWEARSCRGCKHEDRGLYDEPCVSCEPGKYNLWEAKA